MHQDYNAMGDIAKICPHVPSTYAPNAILSLPIIHSIPSRQIYVAIDTPWLVPSVACFTTSSYVSNDVCAAHNIFHAKNI
jgi:hypothetical protein